MAERKPISGRLRFEVLRRDGHKCHYCGATAADAKLTVDHIVPVALGGSDGPDNLVTACQPCNAGKSATGPDEQVVEEIDERAEQWTDAIKRAAELQNAQRDSRDKYVMDFNEAWCSWSYAEGEPPMRPTMWAQSVGVWHDAGLEIETLVYLIDDVMPRRVPNGRIWRYFCGAVWRTLSTRQTIAQGLLEAPK